MPRRAIHPLRKECIKLSCDTELVFADGYDEAILGVAIRDGHSVVAYNSEAVIDILCQRDGMDRDEAEEFFDFNIQGAWIGEATPIFVAPVRQSVGRRR